MLIFYWLLPLLVKIDTAIFEVIMTIQSEDTLKKAVSATVDVPKYKQTLLRNTYNSPIIMLILQPPPPPPIPNFIYKQALICIYRLLT